MIRLKAIIVLLFLSKLLYSQDLLLTTENPNESTIQNILSKNSSYKSVDFIKIDLPQIIEKEEYTITIHGEKYKIQRDSIDVRGINNFFFTGLGENIHVMISVLGTDIQGVIETPKNVFTIETYEKTKYLLITVDYSMLVEDCNQIENEIIIDDTTQKNGDDEIIYKEDLKMYNDYECKIRVLVLYTPQAESSVSNIINTILTAVSLSNQSFINSQINYRIELVYAGETSYSESSYQTDLQRFKTPNDGYMDEVHVLRNLYSADICVLLSFNENLCGIANGIGVGEDGAFCLVSTYSTCATSNYSFIHEIGHLLGCRHDIYVDPNTTPFAYGHGYINPSGTWRTVMAYSNGCNNCPRLLYWSNPNISYAGDAMGTSSTQNNTRVWNNQSPSVMAFRQAPNVVMLNSSSINNADYLNVQAIDSIKTSGTLYLDKNVFLTATEGIVLKPGVEVPSGSSFEAKISNVSDCGDCDNELKRSNVQEPLTKITTKYDVDIYPNPSNGKFNVAYNLSEESCVSIFILNIFGENIYTALLNKFQVPNSYNIEINLSKATSAVYFVIFDINGEKIIKKLIIK